MRTVGVLHSDDAFFSAVIEEFVGGRPEARFASVVPVSEFLGGRVAAKNIPGLLCHRIPCGVPVPELTTSASTGRFRLVYVGRLVEEQKRISDVARALCEAAARHAGLDAVIAGEGSARPEVERLLAAHPHGSKVRLAGRLNRQEVYDLLRTAHGFVLLSDYEGLPVSMLEAMATGVVPICLNTRSGINEVLRSGHNGLMVEDRGEAFQQAVTRLVTEPAFWSACSEEARRTVERDFSKDVCHQKWFEVFDELRTTLRPTRFPVTLPARVASPHPLFAWHEPDIMDRLLPFATPLRNRIGRWRQRVFAPSTTNHGGKN